MEKRTIDVKEFARNIERLCDFLIERTTDEVGYIESRDLRVLSDLKEDAADIQCDRVSLFYDNKDKQEEHVVKDENLDDDDESPTYAAIDGLSNYMRGLESSSHDIINEVQMKNAGDLR